MAILAKTFDQLSTRELYEILRLRSAVFIVEQQGCYQDLDGVDYDSLHIFETAVDGSILSCLRIFPKPGEPGTVQIGRLAAKYRRQGLGTRLMQTAEVLAADRYEAQRLFLTGRRSARAFYCCLGYQATLPACFHTEQEAFYFEFRKSLHP